MDRKVLEGQIVVVVERMMGSWRNSKEKRDVLSSQKRNKNAMPACQLASMDSSLSLRLLSVIRNGRNCADSSLSLPTERPPIVDRPEKEQACCTSLLYRSTASKS